MNASPFLKAGSYLAAQGRGSRAPKSPAPFITLSREAGAGGSSLAHLLAERLQGRGESPRWQVYGGNVVGRMLQAHHLSERLARFLPEDHISEVVASIGELVGLHPSLWEMVQMLNETFTALARGGHVILVGRGANFATAGLRGGTHVRLIGPADQRARAWADFHHISVAEARGQIVKVDAARRRYIEYTFSAEEGNPAAYDLVINTAQVPLVEAADLVAMHVRTKAAAVAA